MVADQDAYEALLAELVGDADGSPQRGAQLFVWHDGSVVADVAVGGSPPGTRMTNRTVHNLYCGLKPVVAMTVARLLEAHGLDEDADIAELLGEQRCGVTVAMVCSHAAGLSDPDAFTYHLASEQERGAWLETAGLLARAESGRAAYSEVAGWSLLALLITRLSGEPPHAVVERDIALAGASDVWFVANGYEDPRLDRLGCYIDDKISLPLLHDRLESFWAPARPVATSGFASMSGLGRWYVALLGVREGTNAPGFPSSEVVRRWTSPSTVVAGGLHGTRSFAMGVLAPLTADAYGDRISSNSFGHSGFLGNSFVAVDASARLVVALMSNWLEPSPELTIERRRGGVLDWVSRELDRV